MNEISSLMFCSYIFIYICNITPTLSSTCNRERSQLLQYEDPAKRFVTGFGLLQCYVLSNIFLLQTFKVFHLY